MTLRIYNISKRVSPFTPQSSEGDFISGTCKIFNDNKIDVRVFLPRYGYISERKFVLREVIRLKEIPVKRCDETIISSVKSAFIPDSRVQVYFNIYPDFYLDISKQATSNYKQLKNEDVYNAFMLYNFAAINTLERLYWQPNILMCYNWHSALIAILLKTVYKDNEWYKDMKTVLVLSADEPFFSFTKNSLEKYHLPEELMELTDPDTFLKKSIQYSDAVIRIDSDKDNKLSPLLEADSVKKLLSDKGELYKSFDINSPVDVDNNEYWGPIAKELYEFLETV